MPTWLKIELHAAASEANASAAAKDGSPPLNQTRGTDQAKLLPSRRGGEGHKPNSSGLGGGEAGGGVDLMSSSSSSEAAAIQYVNPPEQRALVQ